MERSIEDLRNAVGRFRAAHASAYLAALAGETASDPQREADLQAPCEEERVAAYPELAPFMPAEQHAALGAHLLRAAAERAYRPARVLMARAATRPAESGGDRRALYEWLDDSSLVGRAAGRDRLRQALRNGLGAAVPALHDARAAADRAVAEALQALRPVRHPDAGPEPGAPQIARAWLDASADLTREALSRLSTDEGSELRHETDVWAALRGEGVRGYVPPTSRAQRIGEAWAPLGLRDVLNRSARASVSHLGFVPSAHVVVREAPGRLVIAPPRFEAGVASELAVMEATGKALGYALVNPALPLELRHPSVASVARLFGGVGVVALASALPWRQRYAASSRDASRLARLTAAWLLCHSRLTAAALLGRAAPLEHQRELAEEALGVEVAPEIAPALLTRLSPGGAARALCVCADVCAALRERFDEDWYRNPRAAEPLRGAAHRGGGTSAEEFAAELGAEAGAGLRLLAELF